MALTDFAPWVSSKNRSIVGSQEPGAGSQESGVRSQESGVRSGTACLLPSVRSGSAAAHLPGGAQRRWPIANR